MNEVTEFKITEASKGVIYGEMMGTKPDTFSRLSVALLYWRDGHVWRETKRLETATTLTFWSTSGKTTHGSRWSIVPTCKEPVEISLICWPSNQPLIPEIESDEQFYGLPRYSATVMRSSGYLFSNDWSIAPDEIWLTNFRLDACGFPRSDQSYGTVEAPVGSDLTMIKMAFGRQVGKDQYRVVTNCPITLEQVYTTIYEWNMFLDQEKCNQIGLGWEESVIFFCYDARRHPQIFGCANKDGSYTLTSDALKKPNVHYIVSSSEKKPEGWGKMMSTENLEMYMEAMSLDTPTSDQTPSSVTAIASSSPSHDITVSGKSSKMLQKMEMEVDQITKEDNLMEMEE